MFHQMLSMLLITASCVVSATRIVSIDQTHRVFTNGTESSWEEGYDALTTLGYQMTPVQPQNLGKQASRVQTALGDLTLKAEPPLYALDFSQSYSMATPWPYCASLSKCEVFSQTAASTSPIHITLPAQRVKAIDFYIDLAINCVDELAITVLCTVNVTATGSKGSDLSITRQLSSICSSPAVGAYFGFYIGAGEVGGGQEEADTSKFKGFLSSVAVQCGSTVSRVVGLMRIAGAADQEGLENQALVDAVVQSGGVQSSVIRRAGDARKMGRSAQQ